MPPVATADWYVYREGYWVDMRLNETYQSDLSFEFEVASGCK